jgi:HlyD family secretion protein
VVATLADDHRIHVLAEVDENDVAEVRVGQPAHVHIDAFPGEVFEGVVRKVSSSGTSDGGVSSFEIEIELAPDERVRVGMSADARVEVRRHRGVLLVPNTALVRTEEGVRVRVVRKGDGFELVSIDEGYSDGFQTVVLRGLSEGDTVLVRSDGAGP